MQQGWKGLQVAQRNVAQLATAEVEALQGFQGFDVDDSSISQFAARV
jgi:hypothetical protein